MINKIARKEFIELVRDGRFRWTALIVVGLLLTALGFGWKNYSTVKREQAAAEADSRRTWEEQGERNPHSAAHFGVYAFKPKVPLSLVDSGLDSYTGRFIWVEAHYQNPSRGRPVEDATALQRFGELTAAGILQLLLPLVIIFLTFDALAGERVSGTLRQVLSLGVPRFALVGGKTLGHLAALSLILVPAALVGVLALSLATANDVILESAPRFLLMCLSYLFYFGAFVGVSLAVSAFSPTTRHSLILLIGFWIFACLLVPRAANDLSERLVTIPSSEEFWENVDKSMQEGIDGHDPANKRTKELEQQLLARYGVEKVEDLPVNFTGIALNAGEEFGAKVFDKHYAELWREYYAQENIHRLAGIVSPLMPARSVSMGLAGTDLAHNEHFATAVEQYRRDFNRYLNSYFAEYSTTKQGYSYFVNREVWDASPKFVYAAPDTNWVLSRQALNLGLLCVWCFGALGLAVFAAGRMKAF